MPSGNKRSDRWILAIGIFKLVKAAALVALATGALELLHRDVGSALRQAAEAAHIDPNGSLAAWVVAHVPALTPHRLVLVAVGTAVYAALFLIEGIGLVLRKRWGEIVTVIITGSFIPWEVYEAIHAASPAKLVLIALNVGIVAYLVWRLRSDRREPRGQPVPA